MQRSDSLTGGSLRSLFAIDRDSRWLGQNPGSARTALEQACCKLPSVHFSSILDFSPPLSCHLMHNPSIILHSDTTSKRGFNMATKSKKSAASEKSTAALREAKLQYQQSPPQPRHHMIKDDETLLIDPAIVAAEHPDVSHLSICPRCSTVKAFPALAGYSYPASYLDPCCRHHYHPHATFQGGTRQALSTRPPIPHPSHRHTLSSVV
jgi:hypothetical protein